MAKYLIRAHVPPPLPLGQIGLREREVQAGSREIGFLEPLIKPQCMPQHPISFFALKAPKLAYVFGFVLSGYYVSELFTEEVSLISPSGLRFICLSLDC